MLTMYELRASQSAARVLDLMKRRGIGEPPPTPERPPPRPQSATAHTQHRASLSRADPPKRPSSATVQKAPLLGDPIHTPTPPARRKRPTGKTRQAASTPKAANAQPADVHVSSQGAYDGGRPVRQGFLYQSLGSHRQHYGPCRNPHRRMHDSKAGVDSVFEACCDPTRPRSMKDAKGRARVMGSDLGTSLVNLEYERRRRAGRHIRAMRHRLKMAFMRRYFCRLESWWIVRERRRQRRHWGKPCPAESPRPAPLLHSLSDGEELREWNAPECCTPLCTFMQGTHSAGGERGSEQRCAVDVRLEEEMVMKRCMDSVISRTRGLELLYSVVVERGSSGASPRRGKAGWWGGGIGGAACPNLLMLLEMLLGVFIHPHIPSQLYNPPSLKPPPLLGSPLRHSHDTPVLRATPTPSPLLSPGSSSDHIRPTPTPSTQVSPQRRRRKWVRRALLRERSVDAASSKASAPSAPSAPSPSAACEGKPYSRLSGRCSKRPVTLEEKELQHALAYRREPTPGMRHRYAREMHQQHDEQEGGAQVFMQNLRAYLWRRRVQQNLADPSIADELVRLKTTSVGTLRESVYCKWRDRVLPVVLRNRSLLSRLNMINVHRQRDLLLRSWKRFHTIITIRLSLRYSSFNVLKRSFRTLARFVERNRRLKGLKRNCLSRTREQGHDLLQKYFRRLVLLEMLRRERLARAALYRELVSDIELPGLRATLRGLEEGGDVVAEWGRVLDHIKGEINVAVRLFCIRRDAKTEQLRLCFVCLEEHRRIREGERKQKQQMRDLRKQIAEKNGNSYVARQFRKLKTAAEQNRLQFFMDRLGRFAIRSKTSKRVQAWWRDILVKKANKNDMNHLLHRALVSDREERERTGYCACHGAPKIVCLRFLSSKSPKVAPVELFF